MPALSSAEVHAIAGLIDELDYYQILEVDRSAPASQVKRAYHVVSRRFHPDANRALEGNTRAALERVAKRVTEAYSVLRNPRRRQAYDGQLGGDASAKRIQLADAEARAEKTALEQHMGKTPNGRKFFALAKADIDAGRLDSAARNLKMALTYEAGNEYFQKKLDEVRAALKG